MSTADTLSVAEIAVHVEPALRLENSYATSTEHASIKHWSPKGSARMILLYFLRSQPRRHECPSSARVLRRLCSLSLLLLLALFAACLWKMSRIPPNPPSISRLHLVPEI